MVQREQRSGDRAREAPPHGRVFDKAVESRCYEIFSRWNGGPEDAVSAWLEAEREVYCASRGVSVRPPDDSARKGPDS